MHPSPRVLGPSGRRPSRCTPGLSNRCAPKRLSYPGLWWFEVRNILVVNERRRRITASATAAFLLHLARLRVRVDRLPDENAVLRLARTYRLSVYDSAYLELAQREGLPLATLDAALQRAAAGEGVVLVSSGSTGAAKGPPPGTQRQRVT